MSNPNPLRLPFDFPPNAPLTTTPVQKNFETLLQFVQDLNDGVTALANLLVSTLTTTSTATIGGALAAHSTATVTGTATITGTLTASNAATIGGALTASGTANLIGAVTAGSTLDATGDITAAATVKLANGSVSIPALRWTNSTAAGLYRIGANNIGIATGGAKGWEIDTDGNILQTRQPAFRASVASGATQTGQLTPIPFTNEVFDVASNYNNATSTFTAPVDGKYFFSFVVFLTSNGASRATSFSARILVNGGTETATWFDNLISGQTIGATEAIIIALHAGDTVNMTVVPNNIATSTWQLDFISGSYWTGTLVN